MRIILAEKQTPKRFKPETFITNTQKTLGRTTGSYEKTASEMIINKEKRRQTTF